MLKFPPKMLPLHTTLLVWIAVWGFQATLSAKYNNPSESRTYYSPKISRTYGKASRPPLLQNPCLGRTAKISRASSVVVFITTFKRSVSASESLTNLFNSFSQTSGTEFADGIYPEILKALIDVGTPNPEFVSEQAAEAIEESFDMVSSDIVIQVYASSVAKYLFLQGILSQQNAVELGRQYAGVMEIASNTNDSPFSALSDGFVNFLSSLGQFTKEDALFIDLLYANEWRITAKSRQG